jgi:DNA-binding HxlR family transcriptional regulator
MALSAGPVLLKINAASTSNLPERIYSQMREPVKKAPSGNVASPRRRPNPVSGCPLTAAMAAVGGKWKLIIVSCLAESPRHFAGLRQVMPSISQKVLTQQLRELAGDGIVSRRPKGSAPAPVEYSLTDYGRSLLPLVEAVRLWGRGHIERLASEAGAAVTENAISGK